MRFYQQRHKFYCGIDLHAKKMYLCILDEQGQVVLHRNMTPRPEPHDEPPSPAAPPLAAQKT